MKRIELPEFISLMELFGITDRRFIAPLFQQLIEADGFGGDGVEFVAAMIRSRRHMITSRRCTSPRRP